MLLGAFSKRPRDTPLLEGNSRARGQGERNSKNGAAAIVAALRCGLEALGVGLPPQQLRVVPVASAEPDVPRGKRSRKEEAPSKKSLQITAAAASPVQQLLGRESQVDAIKFFLADDVHTTLQLFGMPGTGKTAAVKFAIRSLPTAVTAVFLNGYVIQKSTDLYQAIYVHLARERLGESNSTAPPAGEHCAALLEKRFRNGWGAGGARPGRKGGDAQFHGRATKSKLCVIVIDEMDKALEKCAKAILKLVDWLTLPYTNCKVIAIANSMEVSVDAKTRSRLESTQKVVFPPYAMSELQAILVQRIGHISPQLFADSAVQFVCRQTASHCGDVRRLLQSTAAAVHSMLCSYEEGGEAPVAPKDVSSGIITVHHLSSVISKVFQDRFQEFIKSITSPLQFLVVCAVTVECEKIEQAAASSTQYGGHGGSGAGGVSLDALFSVTSNLIELYRKSISVFPSGYTLKWARFLEQIELLRQVAFLELVACGQEQTPLSSMRDVFDCAEDVRVIMLQPAGVISTLCRLHEPFGPLLHKYLSQRVGVA